MADVVPPGSAVFTPNEMLRTLIELTQEVHALRDPIERIGKVIDDHETRLRQLEQREDGSADVADLELRMRDLERWRWSVGTLLAGGGGAIGALLTKFFGG